MAPIKTSHAAAPTMANANALVLPHVLEFCLEESRDKLAELAVLVGAGSRGEDPGALAHKFVEAVRNLRTEVGIPDKSEQIRRADFDDIAALAIAEGAAYPVPRLLDKQSVEVILSHITV